MNNSDSIGDLADYFTKHHPPAHHQNVRAEFLTRVADLQALCEHDKQIANNGLLSKSTAMVC